MQQRFLVKSKAQKYQLQELYETVVDRQPKEL